MRGPEDRNARPRLNVANLRHALESSTEGLTFIVAGPASGSVACGFVEGQWLTLRLPTLRLCPTGAGWASVRRFSPMSPSGARALGKDVLQLQVVRSDESSRSFLEHRGFQKVGGEEAVSLRLEAPQQPPAPPDGIRLFSRRERPEAEEAVYAVYDRTISNDPRYSEVMTSRVARTRHRTAHAVTRTGSRRLRRRRGGGIRRRRDIR